MRASRGMGIIRSSNKGLLDSDGKPKARKLGFRGKEDSLNGQEDMKGLAKGGWIKDAIGKPGALHKQLGVPMGQKIPAKKLAKAAQAGGTLGKRARLAETLRGFKK